MSSQLIIALDFPTADEALNFVQPLSPDDCKLKVGFELFVSAGSNFVKQLIDKGFDVFLDLKFHDIPNTVAAVCRVAAKLGVWMINVHASGGEKMLHAARNAVNEFDNPPKLIAVTVLTSMDNQQLTDINVTKNTTEQVLSLAKLAQKTALDGVVCSAQEAHLLRENIGKDFLLITPGIRPTGSKKGDQKRVMTPEKALQAGVNYMVIGRPITQSNQPLEVIKNINDITR